MQRSTDRDPIPARTAAQPGFATARTIALAMVMGVAMLWLVAWFSRRSAGVPREGNPPISPQTALLIWGALALGSFVAMLVIRGRALAASDEAVRSGSAGVRAGEIQSQLIVCFALVEAPALFAGVMYMLTGAQELAGYALPAYLVGVALTFPRAEWFGVDPRKP